VGVNQARKTERTTGFFRPVDVAFLSSPPSGVFFDLFLMRGATRMAQRRSIRERLMGRVKKMLQDPSEIIMVW
jgi:hypothetical protein